MSRLSPTSKAGVVLLALLGAGLLLASGSRTWVTGTVDDAVLGASRISGTGTQVASGVIALALAAAAAGVASTTSGPVVRRLTLALLALAAAGEAFFTARVLLDPSGVLGSVAAASTGRTGRVETHAVPTVWPWVALVAVVLLLTAAAGGWVGARRWQGLGARYETPGPTPPVRAASGWAATGTASTRGRTPRTRPSATTAAIPDTMFDDSSPATACPAEIAEHPRAAQELASPWQSTSTTRTTATALPPGLPSSSSWLARRSALGGRHRQPVPVLGGHRHLRRRCRDRQGPRHGRLRRQGRPGA